MAIKVLYDLDLEVNLAKVYEDAQDTIKYLQDLVKSIEARVLEGEEIHGLRIEEKRGNRFITKPGEKYLANMLGENVVYEIKKEFIGITKLNAIVGDDIMDDLLVGGYVAYKEGKPKVVLEK